MAVGVDRIAANAARYVRQRPPARHRDVRPGGDGRLPPPGAAARRVPGRQPRPGRRREPGPGSDAWREWLAEDNRVRPADEAALPASTSRAGWTSLPARKRRVAELLAEGHDGVTVARLVGVTPGRVSQVRAELEASWAAFQAERSRDDGRMTVGRSRPS